MGTLFWDTVYIHPRQI